MFIIAQILGLIAGAILIASIQFKSKKNIIILIALSNILFALSFDFLGAYSGALICFVSAIQALISYIYNIKNKKFPKILIPIYFLISIACAVITYKTYIDILPIVCSILYVLIITQTKEKYIRIISLISITLWLIYNAFTSAYTVMISETFFAISTTIAIVRYDILKKSVTKKEGKK